MIRIVRGSDRDKSADLFDDLFRLRYQVFVKGRGWSLPTNRGCETDQYDTDDTVYFIDLDQEGAIVGSVRITPTDRYSLLADYFPHLVSGGNAPRSAQVYEATRYIVRPTTKSPEENRRAKARLIAASLDWSMHNGITTLQTVIDVETLATFIELSPQVTPMGLSHPYGGGRGVLGGGECVAITVPVTEQVLSDVLAYGRITAEDLATDIAA